jgi:coatomer subunit beta
MLVLSSILHLGRSGLPAKPITEDDFDRIVTCLKILSEQHSERNEIVGMVFKKDCRSALEEMLEAQGDTFVSELLGKSKKSDSKDIKAMSTQPDAPVQFCQLSKTNDLSSAGDIFELGLSQALGTAKKGKLFSSNKSSFLTKFLPKVAMSLFP